tara:strand:+ start:3478 stop:4545 length:1068 start_codon:yes stop_codon:yes gene_type:complete
MFSTIQDATLQLVPGKRRSSTGGWLSFNGVCCHHNGETPDTRGRGGLHSNPDGSISYHCFNCEFKTSYQPGRHLTYKFRKLLSWLGAGENDVKRLVIEAIRIKELIGEAPVKQNTEEKEIEFKARSLPEGSLSFDELLTYYEMNDWRDCEFFGKAVEYVTDRAVNITVTDPGKYNFYLTSETAYNLHKRVVIPCYWKNEIIGYTARAIVADVKPKFHNSYEGNFVFNTDQQHKDNKFVIVCEGPFDAMSVDGVAVLSAQISEHQADIIDSLGKEVIVVPDFDMEEYKGKQRWAGLGLVKAAQEYGWSVSFPVWAEQCKDINEAVVKYGKLFVIKSIIDATERSRLKIELKKKKYE